MWGYFDLLDERRFDDRFPGAVPIHDRILNLLIDSNMSATWAVVGGLALADSRGADDPRVAGLAQTWRQRIRAGDECSAELWYARRFIERLRDARPTQDIGLHGGLTHLPWGLPTTDIGQARWELTSGAAALAELGIQPRSFVFPRDLEAHHTLLREAGVGCYRGRAPIWSERFGYSTLGSCLRAAEEIASLAPPVVWPAETLPGLWNVPASMALYSMARGRARVVPLRRRRERVRLGLEQASRCRGIFHLTLHPENLAESAEAFPMFETIVGELVEWRDRGDGEILTMRMVLELCGS
jgi:peptidoglycan/xylan/chitin deacetylase (PgdA/CDA1 family)